MNGPDKMIQVTVALNKRAASIAASTGEKPDLPRLIGSGDGIRVLKVFGRGRFANVEISQEGYELLKERLQDVCVLTPALRAQPF